MRRSRRGLNFHSRIFTKPLSRLRRQRLAAARSRHGSDSPPDCHSLPCRHFAALKGSQADFLLTFGSMWALTATESSYIEPRRALRNVPFLIPTLEYNTDSHRGNPIVFSKKVMDFRFIPMCDFRFIPTLVDNIIFYLYNSKQDCY